MQACLILLTLAVSPSTTQTALELLNLVFPAGSSVNQKLDALSVWLNLWKDSSEYDLGHLVRHSILQADWEALVETVLGVQNTTNQLIADSADLIETFKLFGSQLIIEIEGLKSRQAVAGAIQGVQIFLFLAYLTTIAVCCLVKRCKKHQKEVAKAEFELLEANLRSSKARRRAAAAQEKSAQAHSLE